MQIGPQWLCTLTLILKFKQGFEHKNFSLPWEIALICRIGFSSLSNNQLQSPGLGVWQEQDTSFYHARWRYFCVHICLLSLNSQNCYRSWSFAGIQILQWSLPQENLLLMNSVHPVVLKSLPMNNAVSWAVSLLCQTFIFFCSNKSFLVSLRLTRRPGGGGVVVGVHLILIAKHEMINFLLFILWKRICITFEASMSSYNFGSEGVLSTVNTVILAHFPAYKFFFFIFFPSPFWGMRYGSLHWYN